MPSVVGCNTMLALESLVSSFGSFADPYEVESEESPVMSFHSQDIYNISLDADNDDLWPYSDSSVFPSSGQQHCRQSSIVASLSVVSSCNKTGSNIGPSPSRQSCLCPLCGRHIAQRRSLKQHLMSNFHRLAPCKADVVVKNFLLNGRNVNR